MVHSDAWWPALYGQTGSAGSLYFAMSAVVTTCVNFYEESAVKSKLQFFCFYSSGTYPGRRPQKGQFSIWLLPLVARVMPPKRTVTMRQDSPCLAGSLLLSQETTNGRASGLAASRVGAALALA